MKDEEKKLTIKRIWIFLFFAFIFNYIIGIAFSDKQGGITSVALGGTVMLYPAIANIITRIITKEGVEEHYLRGNVKKHKWVYIGAVLFPIIAGFVIVLAMHFCFDRDTDMGEMFDLVLGDMGGTKMFVGMMLMGITQTIPLLFMGFGEEFGWRAYLTPKLEKLMPRWAAICITGVIWGVWHAPLIWYGYDFGTGYPGFPYVGVIAMAVGCIPFSYVLTEMTERSKSVFPAAICHMLFDIVVNYPLAVFVDRVAWEENSLLAGTLILGFPQLLVSIGIIVYKLTKKKSVKSAAAA